MNVLKHATSNDLCIMTHQANTPTVWVSLQVYHIEIRINRPQYLALKITKFYEQNSVRKPQVFALNDRHGAPYLQPIAVLQEFKTQLCYPITRAYPPKLKRCYRAPISSSRYHHLMTLSPATVRGLFTGDPPSLSPSMQGM